MIPPLALPLSPQLIQFIDSWLHVLCTFSPINSFSDFMHTNQNAYLHFSCIVLPQVRRTSSAAALSSTWLMFYSSISLMLRFFL